MVLVYDALREIATTYEIGMQIVLDPITYTLGFRSYKGLDRTSRQSDNSLIRFSPHLESFTNIKELQSIASLKTLVYTFAPTNPDGLAYQPGVSFLSDSDLSGFDLRVLMVFAEDITTDMVDGDATKLIDILNSRSKNALTTNRFVRAIDGEIVPNNQYTYKQDYFLGDLIEVQGKTETIQVARVSEYIRSHDASGEKSYPTLTMLDSENDIIEPGTPPEPPAPPPVAAIAVRKPGTVETIEGFTSSYVGGINLAPFVGEIPAPVGFYNLVPRESLTDSDTLLVWVDYFVDPDTYRRVYRVKRNGTHFERLIEIHLQDLHADIQATSFAMEWYEDTDGSIRYYDLITGTDGYKNLVARNAGGDEIFIMSYQSLPSPYNTTGVLGVVEINNSRDRVWILVGGLLSRYYIVNIDTGVVLDTGLSPGYGTTPVYGNVDWSPNNIDVAYDVMLSSVPRSIRKINSDTGAISTIYENTSETAACSGPFYSKTGNKVGFTRKPVGDTVSYLAVKAANGTGPLETLTSTPVGGSGGYSREQSFSVDDSKIVFSLWDASLPGVRIWNRADNTVFNLTEDYAVPVMWLDSLPVVPPPPPPVVTTVLPRNVAQLGNTLTSNRALTATHTIKIQDTLTADGILIVASAPSNPLSGDPLGLPVSCTDTAGNVYTLIHTSKFEDTSPVVNLGGVVALFFCQSSVRALIKDVDQVTVTWSNSVYDRNIVAWLTRHDGGAHIPTILAATPDSNATAYANSGVSLTSPAWTPARANSLELALLFSWQALGGSGGGWGGIGGYDGFYEATSIGLAGSKQIMNMHQQTHGANVYIVVGSGITTNEIDLGNLPGGVLKSSFNGVGQNYSHSGVAANNKWKGIILLGID